MLTLSKPRNRNLKNLQDWMERPTMGNVYLIGLDRHLWSQGDDMIALENCEQEINNFSEWLLDRLRGFHYQCGRRFKKPKGTADFNLNTVHYSDSKIAKVAGFFGTVLSCLLPVLAIVILYMVNGMSKRLGLVGLFTAIFSACLWFMTDGRLVEIFSGTSAFAAVQVVFISASTTLN